MKIEFIVRKDLPMRRFSVILLFFCLLWGLISCGESSSDGTESEIPPDHAQPVVEKFYQIVRSDDSSKTLTSAAVALKNAIRDRAGYDIVLTTDWDKNPVEEYEILIGETLRAESDVGELDASTFVVREVGTKIVITGGSENAVIAGINYFIEEYVNKMENTGKFAPPTGIDVSDSTLNRLLALKTDGSSKKKAYSDYIKTYTEKQLLSFDDLDTKSLRTADGVEIDSTYMREGSGAMRWTLDKDYNDLVQMMQVSRNAFEFAVKDKRTTTLKFWLFINDTDLISCDHDSQYGIQENQATFFIRVTDKNGRTYCWNHTITDNGWHEIELSFNVHNGVDADFDYDHITGFWIMFSGKAGAVVELDDLRAVEYTTDYKPEAVPAEWRVITDAEYDALDGAIVQEWYGTYYDTEDKVQGKSSLCCEGDASVNDFRLIIANTSIPLDYDQDVLVFWMKLEKFASCNGLFLELNHVQDQHEYEKSVSLDELKAYGLDKENEWCQVVIPLTDFKQNLKPDVYGKGEDIVMQNFRFVMNPVSGMDYKVHMDRAYFTTKDALN